MDSPGGGILGGVENIAGRALGTIGMLASLRGGGLINYMNARARALSDPASRATLIDSPFTAGTYLVGMGGAPPSGAPAVAQPGDGTPAVAGVAAPQDVRYLPAGGRSYPDVAPLDYATQVKAEQDRSTMIGLTSNDPAIRTQSKLAIGVPLTNDEITQAIGAGRGMVAQAGAGSQVQYKLPGGAITVGSPYIAGNYLSQAAAEDYARKTGKVVVPSPTGGFQVVDPQQPAEHEYTDPAQAAAALQPGEQTVPSGRTINGVPSYLNIKKQPTGVTPLEQRPAVQPAKPTPPTPEPAPPEPARTAPPPPARPAPPPPPARPAPPPPPPPSPPPPDTGAPPSQGAPPPAPAPAAPAPQPPPPPPHEVLRLKPDGTFERVPPAPPARVAPRSEAAPVVAPPMLAAGAPPLFQFPGQARPAPAPVMVARAEPSPPYQVVPGAELSGVASGAPPAPAEERAAPPPPVPPAPAAAVPWQQETPGQAERALTPAYPGGMPAGTQRVTETRPLPGQEGGTVSYEETTPAGLDFERRRELMQKDIELQYGKIPESKDLAGKAVVRGVINDLLNTYSPEQRAQYLGYVTPWLKEFFGASDPAYQTFLQMNAQIRDAAIAAGIPERAVANFPTGTERTAADYESRLRGSVNMIDKMMAAPGVFESMHPADLTPAKLQKVTDQYLSGPSPVHFGAYPWDERTGAVIPTETTTTTTTPRPTTTTLYPVDVRRTVQPSQPR